MSFSDFGSSKPRPKSCRVCTGAAVLGGKHMATRVSERAVAITGGALFVLFGVHALVTGVEA